MTVNIEELDEKKPQESSNPLIELLPQNTPLPTANPIQTIQKPSAPENLNFANWHNSTTQSPKLNFTGGPDNGVSVLQYEVKIQEFSTDYSDLTSFSLITSGSNLNSINLSPGNRYRFVMRAVAANSNYSDLVYSGDWKIDNQLPQAVLNLTSGTLPKTYLSFSPSFSFINSTDSGGSGINHYLVELVRVSDNVVIKTKEIVGIGITTTDQISDAVPFMVAGETYFLRVSAIDGAGNSSSPMTTSSWVALQCPDQYIMVPAHAPHTEQAFCAAQFEMKINGIVNGNMAYNSSYIAETRPDGTPWVNINRDQAISECQSLGLGYDLMNNSQWQSIAQNAELQTVNWTSSVIGSEMMYRGHTDDNPSQALSVLNVNDPYNQTGNNATEPYTSGKNQRRTHILSNGSEIWDMGGNVWEWLKDDNFVSWGTEEYVSLITNTSHPFIINGLTTKSQFGTFGSYGTLGAPYYGGFGRAFIDFVGVGTMLRGGRWGSPSIAGIFSSGLDHYPNETYNYLGFRCVYLK